MTRRPPLLLLIALTVVPMSPAAASEAPRQVTLEVSAPEVEYGQSVTFSGQVSAPTSAPPGCVAGANVIIRAMGPTDIVPTPPPNKWGEVGRTTTAADGTFTFTHSPRSNASWAAHLPAEDPAGCDEAVSKSLSVSVRVKVELSVRDRTLFRGDRAKFTARVQPYCTGFDRNVTLERLQGGEYVSVAKGEPAETDPCIVKFKQRIRRSAEFRASAPSNCHIVCTHEGGTSRSIKVVARKR